MPKLAIDRDFLLDFGALDKSVQKRIAEVFAEFEAGTHAGLHLEKIKKTRHPRFRSIRINQSVRGIVLAPESGDVYTLLKVLPHDDAYVWAARHDISVNAATGGIEIRDDAAVEESLPYLRDLASAAPALLFAEVGDGDLRRLGIDDRTLEFARALTNVAQLDAARGFLPNTQWEVLYALAAGYTPQEVWSELGAALTAGTVDTDDIDAAVVRSPHRVVLVEGPEDLMAVFARPLELWRIYLHPTQRALADATFRGPARVTGGPGTGKTVVALHRACALARRGGGKVLLTTFTSTLAESLRIGVSLLRDSEKVARRIDVVHIDKLAHQVFRETHGSPRLLTGEQELELWSAIVADRNLRVRPEFLAAEWREVVLAQRITTWEDYRPARRRGRGRGLAEPEREHIWRAIAHFERQLDERKAWTHETVRREAVALLEGRSDKPYRHVIVDEAQDLSPDQWRLLRAAVAVENDDLFLAGDTQQRIYDNRVSLRELGISVTGRSTRLIVNYRTTAEILAWSLGLLRGEPIDDMDGGLDAIARCRSEVHGLPPVTKGFATQDSEVRHIRETVLGWMARGVAAHEIGIATRAKAFGESIRNDLAAAGVPVVDLASSASEEGVNVGTMHRMKGLEFRCLIVAGVGEHSVPARAAVTPIADDKHAHALDLQRERCLLFVACTRAREELSVSWHGMISPFLEPMV
ncbi:UvrD-helicase domain-containing protein [Nocardia takedensis]|uniref:UvrD-helicase domain-containing protein n=1 Tax=Nocardia takedensis TaxID=259390 RepID=UPI0002E6AE72|nr:UvrD-helicase domain-containing protein [Nocardia takedensis]